MLSDSINKMEFNFSRRLLPYIRFVFIERLFIRGPL